MLNLEPEATFLLKNKKNKTLYMNTGMPGKEKYKIHKKPFIFAKESSILVLQLKVDLAVDEVDEQPAPASPFHLQP